MKKKMSSSVQKVYAALQEFGYDGDVLELSDSTKTSELAASAVGCEVKQIAKSLLFKTKKTGKPIMVITSGANRVNTGRVSKLVGEQLKMAEPEFVRECTGYAIGGVPPVGHAMTMTIFIDEDLIKNPEIWAAAGTPNSMFRLSPEALLQMTGGTVAAVKQEKKP
jgi:prolyl-tRNA editing enzyme YbaK/EbsC (Cys-tRNA(Pro) deacylase)